jgi:hypothetical protein
MEMKALSELTLPQKWYKLNRYENEGECNINVRANVGCIADR